MDKAYFSEVVYWLEGQEMECTICVHLFVIFNSFFSIDALTSYAYASSLSLQSIEPKKQLSQFPLVNLSMMTWVKFQIENIDFSQVHRSYPFHSFAAPIPYLDLKDLFLGRSSYSGLKFESLVFDFVAFYMTLVNYNGFQNLLEF